MGVKDKVLSVLKIVGVYALGQVFMIVLGLILMALVPKSFHSFLMSGDYTPLRSLCMLLLVSLNLICTIVPVVIVIKIICKTPMKKIGLLFTASWLKHLIVGLIPGIICTLPIWIVIVASGGYKVQLNPINFNIVFHTFIIAITMVIGAYYEEAMARGAMAYVGHQSGRIFTMITVALLFSIMHAGIGTFNIVSFINLALLAAIFSQLTWISGDLWTAIGFHAAWNGTQFFFGAPVSGTVYGSIFTSEINALKSQFVTGGKFGIESSVVATVVLVIVIVVITYAFIKRGRINHEPVADWLSQ